MSRKILSDDKIQPAAMEKMIHFHNEFLSKVIKTISDEKIVVVGMRQNPVVKKATTLLESKNLEFTYLEYGSYFSEWKKRLAIKLWSGWPTYPQVFIDGKLVGGCKELTDHLQ